MLVKEMFCFLPPRGLGIMKKVIPETRRVH